MDWSGVVYLQLPLYHPSLRKLKKKGINIENMQVLWDPA